MVFKVIVMKMLGRMDEMGYNGGWVSICGKAASIQEEWQCVIWREL